MTEDAPNRPGDRPETLSTERLILRPPSPADASGVLEVHRHPCVAAGVISVPHPCPPDHGETWIAKITAAMEETALRVWLIEDRASGRVIGDCGLDADETHRRGSIGYILHPDHRGRGLMTEALGAVLRHAFCEREPALERVHADVYPENTPSLALCERLGFSREGVLRAFIRKDGTQRDVVRMSILRSEFVGGG